MILYGLVQHSQIGTMAKRNKLVLECYIIEILILAIIIMLIVNYMYVSVLTTRLKLQIRYAIPRDGVYDNTP